jgi:hypothetical protein
MKTFLIIKALIFYTIFAFDFTYDRDVMSFMWLLMAISPTIICCKVWMEEQFEKLNNK